MKMLKKKDGFTLVEIIVVIAILAILAGVAIPAYSGYIKKANETADTTALSAVKTAAMATLATEGTVTAIEVVAASGTISDISVTYGDSNTEVVLFGTNENANLKKDFLEYYGSNTLPTLKAWTIGADWTAAGWVAKTASN